MTIAPVNGMSQLATSPLAGGTSRGRNGGDAAGSWFEALSQAWGQTLDNQASQIESMSDVVGNGNDSPSQITKLTAESLRMSFMSNSSSSSIDSVGKALETMARKS